MAQQTAKDDDWNRTLQDTQEISRAWAEFNRKAFGQPQVIQSVTPDQEWDDYVDGVATRTNRELTSYQLGQGDGMKEGYNLCLQDVARGLGIPVDQVRQLIVDGTPYRTVPEFGLRQTKPERRGWRTWIVNGLLTAGVALATIWLLVGAYHFSLWLWTNVL